MAFDINNYIRENGLCVIKNIDLSTIDFSIPETVQSLIIKYANIKKLPPLPSNLHLLDCGSNELETLPSLPDSLVVLNCDSNKLEQLPDLPKNLYNLSCDINNLTNLPPLPPNLGLLSCNINSLSKLPPLPEKLESIQCFSNNLTSLPRLPLSVTSIDFDNNPLEEPHAKLYQRYVSRIITLNGLRRSMLEISLKNMQSFENVFYIRPYTKVSRNLSGQEKDVASNINVTKFSGKNLKEELQREDFGKFVEGSSLNSLIASYLTGKDRRSREQQKGELQQQIQTFKQKNLLKNLAKKKRNYNLSANARKPNQFYQSLLKGGKTRKRNQKTRRH